MALKNLLQSLPSVAKPIRRLGFKEKLKWTAISLVIFYALSEVTLFGMDPRSTGALFGDLRTILASDFGTLITLGIGPLVLASIIIQLLSGAGVLNFDMNTPEGKATYQGAQKVLALVLTIFEAFILVASGQLAAAPALIAARGLLVSNWLLIGQIFLGGLIILFLDEVISKWGFGSGISLFIAAGVSREILVRSLDPTGQPINGAIPAFIHGLTQGSFEVIRQHPNDMLALFATVIVFVVTMYAQSIKVEVPITYGRVRGLARRYPLPFVYASNMPVIFIAALIANMNFWVAIMNRAGITFFGSIQGGVPTGFIFYISPYSQFAKDLIFGIAGPREFLHAGTYLLVMVLGSIAFSKLWVGLSGMDSESLANKLINSGMQIPGFRSDTRIIQRVLDRYVPYLTVLGGAFVGALAALAGFTGALGGGTGVLLTVGIIYQLYQEIANEQVMDMHPSIRAFIGDNSLL